MYVCRVLYAVLLLLLAEGSYGALSGMGLIDDLGNQSALLLRMR